MSAASSSHPGFIDLHAHSDFTFPAFPDSPGQVSQGVTRELIGHCGDSPAPVSTDPERRQAMEDYDRGVGPTLEMAHIRRVPRRARRCPPRGELPAAGRPHPAPDRGDGHDRAHADARRDRPEAGGSPGSAGGRRLGPEHRAVLRARAVGGERRGASGSRGPSPRARRPRSTPRTSATSRRAAPGRREALSIGEELGVPVEVSHLKAAGVRNFGRTRDALGLIEEARAAGRRAGCDMYPYEAGSTYLSQLFPPWVFDGGIEAMLQRIRSQDVRARIRHDIATVSRRGATCCAPRATGTGCS